MVRGLVTAKLQVNNSIIAKLLNTCETPRFEMLTALKKKRATSESDEEYNDHVTAVQNFT